MLLVLIFSFLCLTESMGEEPRCSRFEFEKNLLEMLVRLEFKLDTEIKSREENDRNILEKINLSKGDIDVTLQQLKATDQEFKTNMTEYVSKEVKDIERTVRNLEDRVSDVDRFQAYSNVTLQKLEATDRQWKAPDQDIIANVTVPLVYFLVKKAKSELYNKRPIFTNTIRNEGDSYDVYTGLFTCRVPGLYNFIFNYVSKSDSGYSRCDIQRNGIEILYVYGQGNHDSSSLVAYMYLELGDTVDIQCSIWDKVYHDSWGTNFSGALIRK